MAKGENQKLKMLYLVKIFTQYTDDQHSLTMQEIIKKLESYKVSADRKTLYLDFAELDHYGLDIISEKIGRNTYYHLGKRQFELPELKLLVDSVQAAKFITDKKSKQLIKKLENLVSTYEAKQLQRQVVISGRIKTPNKLVYNNVDTIYSAIAESKQITFHYFQWDIKGNQVLRHDGVLYQVSPWCLMWDDEYYYLVAYDSEADKIKHYRVDKMKDLDVVEFKREGQKAFKNFDMAKYSKAVFGMFGGEETSVTLECSNNKAGIIIDRFGKDVTLIPKDENTFSVHVNVIPSNQFLGWIMSLGEGVKITGPDTVVHKMQDEVRRLTAQYLK
jgi:predicted DNA-binding transcriptional regulator YafY